jgi:CRISPR-associated protein Cas2
MNFLVAYDVSTEDRQGRRRLRRVARACEGYGQRVQYSLFEVVCSRTNLARLVAKLEAIMEAGVDTIRVYQLEADGFDKVIRLGQRRELPHDGPWIV